MTVAGNNLLSFFQKEIVFDILHIVMRTLFILCKEIRHSLTSMITFNAQGALEKTFIHTYWSVSLETIGIIKKKLLLSS